jgi:hypothetical protein
VKYQRVEVSPAMFQQGQQLTGRDFTKFVSSKGVLCSFDFHLLDEKSSHNLPGHYSWLNAGRSGLRFGLLYYQDCKRKAPSTTSACILVPKDRRGSVVCYAATAGPHRVRQNAISPTVGAAQSLGSPSHAHSHACCMLFAYWP